MILSKKQVEFLAKYIEDLNLLIEKDNVNDILDKIDSLIIINGMTEDQEWLTPFGLELQKIYDDIYNQNT